MELKNDLILLLFSISMIAGIEVQHGTLTNQYGRIDNIDNERIHVAASLTIIDCIRKCADFRRSYPEYYNEDCLAYNYDIQNYSCELIHSTDALSYSISFQTRWMTGLKS